MISGEQAGAAEAVPAGQAHGTFDGHVEGALLGLGGDTKSLWYDRAGLPEVGDIVDEREGLAGVQKPYGRGVSGCEDSGFGQSMQAGSGGGEATIGNYAE